MGSLKAVHGSQWASTGSPVQSMESLQAVYRSLQAVHGNLVQSMESLEAVYSNLVQSRVAYRQSTAILCSLWSLQAVYSSLVQSICSLQAVYTNFQAATSLQAKLKYPRLPIDCP